MPRVYLSLGSNIDREANLRSAISLLRERYGELTISSVYENQAVGFEGDDFYNLVVGLDTGEPVEQLNAWLAEVENQHGRDRSAPKFGPRTLDIDLLLYDDLVYRNGKLSLPRPLKQRLDAQLIRMVIGKPSDYGLPDPDYRLYESHPVINSLVLHHLGHGDITPRGDLQAVEGDTVTFSNGEQQDYDLILMATGYQLDYPFISRTHLNWQQGDAPQLYLNVFHPQYHNLFMMGMVEAAGLGWEGRNEQAELVALYLQAKQQGCASAKRFDRIKQDKAAARVDGGFGYLKLARMAYYVHKDSYRQAVLGHIAAFQKELGTTATRADRPGGGYPIRQ